MGFEPSNSVELDMGETAPPQRNNLDFPNPGSVLTGRKFKTGISMLHGVKEHLL